MKKHYKIKEVNKVKLKSYLNNKNKNKKNERTTRQRTSNCS